MPKAEPKELSERNRWKPLLVAVLPNENPWFVGAAPVGAAPNVPNEKTDEPVEVALDEEPVGAKVDVPLVVVELPVLVEFNCVP